jgi:RecJ-like exonuclease
MLLQTDINGKEYKKIEKSLCKECRNKDKYVIQLKEMLTDVR